MNKKYFIIVYEFDNGSENLQYETFGLTSNEGVIPPFSVIIEHIKKDDVMRDGDRLEDIYIEECSEQVYNEYFNNDENEVQNQSNDIR